MGIQRPDGPYSVEMTAGPAWPGADENSYRDRADELRATLRSLTSTCEQWEQQRATLFNGDLVWSGEAATAAAAEVDKRTAAMHTLQDQLRTAATKADTTAAVIGAVKTQVTENVETAQKIIDQINNTPAATTEQKSAAIQQVVTTTHGTNTAAVAAGAAQLGAAPPATPLNFGPTNTAPPQAPAPKSPADPGDKPQIPMGKEPEEVERWWGSLPQETRDKLLADWPEQMGALDGVPVVDRSIANTTVMQRDIDRVSEVAAARGVTPEEVLAHPERYGMAGQMMDRYHNGLKTKEGLGETAKQTGADTFLQVYQPEAFGGDGRAAVAIGDPDHAADTAVVVPGTGNSVGSGWLAQKDAINLYNEMYNVDPDKPISVVAWMGYDAPDALWDPRVGTTALAREGGQLLAADVNALNATRDGAGHITVFGHSYGSTTVADAAAGFGMKTDDVVLVGSPGTDLARSAADFHLNPGGHLYVGAASSDPVTHLGGLPQTPVPGTGWSVALGTDPALDGYGSTRFKAEVPGLTSPIGDHSQYYTPRSESLYSMAEIATGNGDALAQHDMIARHRIPLPTGLISGSIDPELVRLDIAKPTH